MKSTIRLLVLILLTFHPRLGAQAPPLVQTVYSFPNKVNPSSGVIQDAAGNFYGTNVSGGGTVYQLTPAGQLNALHTFTGTGG